MLLRTLCSIGFFSAAVFMGGLASAEAAVAENKVECPQNWRDDAARFGGKLPEIYRAEKYWIKNYADFRLDPPAADQAWVRYGDDALLIDVSSGTVVRIESGVFE